MNDKSTKYYSTIQENMVAKYLGWKVVSGSGARDLSPGDVISDKYIGECKTHMNIVNDIIFRADVWDKICAEGLSRFKHPVLIVDDGTQKDVNTWIMTSWQAIDISKCAVYECPLTLFKISVNIKFDNSSMKTLRNRLYLSESRPIAFTFKFRGDDVVTMCLEDFREAVN